MPAATTFESRTHAPLLARDEIHVWLVAVEPTSSPREVRTLARAILERLLCEYTGSQSPPRIERGAHGKPFAPELAQLDFNLSHAGTHVLLAFAREQALGVDLEHGARRISIEGVAQRFFSAAEAAALAAMTPEESVRAFLRLWTHKEAVLKALGQGLGFGLDQVEFAFDAHAHIRGLVRIAEQAGAVAEWQVHRLTPASELVGALAWRGKPRRVRTFSLSQ